MVYYARRFWNENELKPLVYIAEEKRWVNLESLSEEEFRRFIIWRFGMGVSFTQPGRKAARQLSTFAESVAEMPSPVKPPRLKYDERHTRVERRR